MDDLVEQLESITDRVAFISPSGVMTDGLRYRDAIVADLRALTAQLDAQPAPIPMILYCPLCGTQHIDAADRTPWPPVPPGVQIESFSGEAAGGALWSDGVTRHMKWTNPPHRSHLCHGCGCTWRPADVATVGVAKIETRGRADTFDPAKPIILPRESAQPAPAVEVAAVTRVPEGWVLVPRGRTETMDEAAMLALCGSIGGYEHGCWLNAWNAALAAAPQPEPTPVVEVCTVGHVSRDKGTLTGALMHAGRMMQPDTLTFADTDPEARFIADGQNLNCPTCGGSGHVGDVRPEAKADDGLDYLGTCSQCGGRFIGHMRQVVCDECRDKQTEATPDQCAAISTGHTMANDGPNGSRQCKFCGEPEAQPEAKAGAGDLIVIGDTITVRDLTQKLALKGGDVVKALFKMGIMATITQTIDHGTAAVVAEHFGRKVAKPKPAEDEPEAPAGADVTDAMIDAGYAAMHRISFAASPRDRLTAMWVAMNAAMPKPAEGGAAADVVANLASALRNLTSGEGDTREHVMRAWEALSAYDALRQTVRTQGGDAIGGDR